jgi:hypothetical protein
VFHNFRVNDSWDEATGLSSGLVPLSSLLIDLIAWWDLEETFGTNQADSHTNELDLTRNGPMNWTGDGKPGNAAIFASADVSKLTHADNDLFDVAGDPSFTWAFWMRADTVVDTGQHTLVCKGPNNDKNASPYFIQIDGFGSGNAKLSFFIGDGASTESAGTATDTIQADNNTWHFIVCTYNNAVPDLTIYVDNSLSFNTSVSITPVSTSDSLTIGASGAAGPLRLYDGDIDSLAFWKRILTSEERASLYNSGAGKSYSEL